ncbi:hypothetical protein KQX54_000431 [Cotesia glomerata]|uniref:Uncharacterized protein n=1 Tax=Cotesia glomerata TaxID=32391 RepID=A0AAV7IJS3_COTGL|nr:hypothetical protein KQX54_000431 [Cotesia glomerata]
MLEVGRSSRKTGADNTSITSALFRLVDQGMHGEIIIDGLDMCKSVDLILTLSENIPIKRIWDVLGEVELNGITLNQWVGLNGGRKISALMTVNLFDLPENCYGAIGFLFLTKITDGLDLKKFGSPYELLINMIK